MTRQSVSDNPVDYHIGSRIRLRRKMLNISQEGLAGLLGVTFQQIQKYERGANRISGSRLLMLSRAMDTDLNFFFEGLEETDSLASAAHPNATNDPMRSQEVLELVAAYRKIPVDARAHLLNLCKVLASPRYKHPSPLQEKWH